MIAIPKSVLKITVEKKGKASDNETRGEDRRTLGGRVQSNMALAGSFPPLPRVRDLHGEEGGNKKEERAGDWQSERNARGEGECAES